MAKELVNRTPPTPPTDGFDTPDDDIGGGAAFIKFDGATQSLWFYRDGGPVPLKPWIAAQCRKEAVRWKDKKIVDRIDESQSPDIDALNAEIPAKDWGEGYDGAPKPPWQMQYSIYFVNPENGSKIISSNSTWGQKAAFVALKDSVRIMRKLRGEHVVPTIELSSTTMRTRFGTKTAPHFLILRDQWVNFGPVASAIAGPVAPPTPAEIVDDSIPDPSGLVVGGVKVAWSAISDHPCPENMPWNDSIPDNL